MKSNYRKIGDFIKRVNLKNSEGKIDLLQGIKIDKYFMPSVANVIGTDLKKYKVVKPNQFSCNRMHVGRDERLPVALSSFSYDIIVSPAYDVFEITDTGKLNTEYLMMWFSRSEFDRNCWFYTDTDVRGKLGWDSFCDMELPVPIIEKQNEIVKEYNTVVNRIKLNEQLNQKLEETAQTIYKHWFVDFEFPNEDGKPYKFSGGKMVFNEELDKEVPEGWDGISFTKLLNLKGGGTPSTINEEYWDGIIPFFTPKDVRNSYFTISTLKNITTDGLNNCSSKLYLKYTVFVTARGTVGEVSIAGQDMAMNQSCYAVIGNEQINQFFVHQITLSTIKKLISEATGAVFKALVTRDFDHQTLIKPNMELIELFGKLILPVYDGLLNKTQQNNKLYTIKELLLSKMSKVELEKEVKV